MSLTDKEYWAAKDAEEIAAELQTKIEEWASTSTSNGLRARWAKCYQYYYGRHINGKVGANESGVVEAGDDGELKLVTVNHYRNLLKHVHIMTTNQKPAFDVRAINSDPESLQQARLANQILDAYLKEKRLARYLKNAAEHALVFGKGFVYVTWEPGMGKPYTVSEQEMPDGSMAQRLEYEGDIEVSTPSVFDVYMDQSKEDWNKVEWVTVRTWRNKFNLAARYVKLRDEIIGLKTKSELDSNMRQSFQELDATTDVPVYAFYHKRTDALPNGRYVLFCDNETVLYDGPIPYSELPLFRIVPGEIFGTTEGYSDGFDLIPLQEVVNVLESAAYTNQAAYSVQNILLPDGSNISEAQIGQGLRGIRFNPTAGKPEALQLTATPREVFENIKMKVQTMETLSGVNSVARGNPESQMGKGSSGAAMALIQSMAVQYMSGFQQSWAELLEDCGTFMLRLLQDFAKTERMIAMAGKNNRGAMKSFTGEDLNRIDRCLVEIGNPMSKTTAGRVQLADTFLDRQLIKTPQEYLQVVSTGQLEAMTQGTQSELDLIAKENERLREGEPVRAIVGDAHLLHTQEHRSVISDSDLRERADRGDEDALAIVQNTLSHIEEHKNLAQTQDPFWSAISGEPSMAQPPPPPPGPPMGPPPGDEMMPPEPEMMPEGMPLPPDGAAPNPAGVMPAGLPAMPA